MASKIDPRSWAYVQDEPTLVETRRPRHDATFKLLSAAGICTGVLFLVYVAGCVISTSGMYFYNKQRTLLTRSQQAHSSLVQQFNPLPTVRMEVVQARAFYPRNDGNDSSVIDEPTAGPVGVSVPIA